MTTNLKYRLIAAGFVLAAGLAAALTAASMGVVHVGAGETKIVLGRGEHGLDLNIAARTCPPQCGVDFDWRPLSR